MSGVAKTAVGFCVGVVTVAAVISVYSQFTEVRAEKKEAAAVRHLTPDYVMSKCGSPSSDELHVLTASGSADRELRYQAATITFYKTKSDEKWNYIAAADGSGNKIDSPRSLPAHLACLDQQ